MDELDFKLLNLIQQNGRASYARLGAQVGLSTSAVNARLARLKERGVIERYAALINPAAVGCDFLCFVLVMLDQLEAEAGFLETIRDLAEVQECHHITGDYSYLLKVLTRGPASFEKFLGRLKKIPGVSRTHSTVALSSPKMTTAAPLAWPGPEEEES